jgi:hypothetical protein
MMNRRKFFGGLVGAASVVAVSSLQSLGPVESVQEVRKGRRYIFKLDGHVPQRVMQNVSESLKAKGIDAVVVDASLDSVYELSK